MLDINGAIDIAADIRDHPLMDQLERAQIRLILEHLTSEAFRNSGEAQSAMHADHAAKGLLRSGSTVRAALKIAEDTARAFMKEVVDQVSAVAQDVDAFAMILANLTAAFNHWDAEISQAVTIASGEADGSKFPSVKREADRLFSEMRARLLRELEIYRFTFTMPPKSMLEKPTPTETLTVAQPSSKVESQGRAARNKGGKPLAPHWDDLWASIAVSLWAGDLKPTSEADIMKAMFDWFTAHEIEVGETAVRQRARQLWMKIEAAS